MKLSVGEKVKRKDDDGKKLPWSGEKPRVKMRPQSYLTAEALTAERFGGATRDLVRERSAPSPFRAIG
jgi:hypothetical protein